VSPRNWKERVQDIELNSRLALARTLYQRGLLSLAQGKVAGALDDFTHALVIFEAMGAQRDANTAQARLETDEFDGLANP